MSKVDLDALRIDRGSAAPAAAPRRPIGLRLLTATVVLLVLGVVASFVVPLLLPVQKVRTERVRAAQALLPITQDADVLIYKGDMSGPGPRDRSGDRVRPVR